MSPKRMSPRVSKIAQPVRTTPVPATPLPAVVEQAWKNDDLDKLIKLAESTKIDVSPFDRECHRCSYSFCVDRVFEESRQENQTGI